LGVILLFAYNWDKMHKFAKLGVVFGTMTAAHGTGLWLRRRESLRGFAESTLLLGTMLFGAGIWLVAQIYHISAHYPNAFFVWAAAALLLAWALPSVAQGLLATVLLAVWACAEVGSFGNHLVVAPLLVLLGTGWLAWRLRSPVLLAAAVVSFAVAAAAGFSSTGNSVYMVLFSVAVSYGSLAWLVRGDQAFPSAHAILRLAGMVLYFPLLFILTFLDAAGHLLECREWNWQDWPWQEWLPVILLPLHHPVRVAEDVITLDIDSKGRVILGVCIGYQPARNRSRKDLMVYRWSGDLDFNRYNPGREARRCYSQERLYGCRDYRIFRS
jgi:hypothetical protein